MDEHGESCRPERVWEDRRRESCGTMWIVVGVIFLSGGFLIAAIVETMLGAAEGPYPLPALEATAVLFALGALAILFGFFKRWFVSESVPSDPAEADVARSAAEQDSFEPDW